MTVSESELLDDAGLAKKLKKRLRWVITWRKSAVDPIPALRLGRAYRYAWGSEEMNAWLMRRSNSEPIERDGKKPRTSCR